MVLLIEGRRLYPAVARCDAGRLFTKRQLGEILFVLRYECSELGVLEVFAVKDGRGGTQAGELPRPR